jgi:transposase
MGIDKRVKKRHHKQMVNRPPPPGISRQDWDATPESVQILVCTLLANVAELQQAVGQLQERVRQLEEQVGKNSRNSSKPPSSDPPHLKKAPAKEKGRRKQGGQPGHEGHGRRLKPAEEVTHFEVSKPSSCEVCGTLLLGEDPQPQRHQVCELPEIKPEIIEYQIHTLSCVQCGHKTTAAAPVGMPPGSFGPQVQAVTALLSGRYMLSRRDVQEILAIIFQVEMGLGTVSYQEAQVSAALQEAVTEAQAYVQQQHQVNVDETGWVKSQERYWLWTATTALVTVFLLLASRSAESVKQLLGRQIRTIVGSDRYSAYNGLDLSQRQVCWAHLLRDFQALVERKGESADVGQLLLQQAGQMFALWYRIRDGTLSRPDFQQLVQPIRHEIRCLLQIGTFLGHSQTVRTCRNILKVEPALWTFVDTEGVEPTNNAAERALRRGVLWRKRSFGSQSERGLRFTERILTVVATLRQQKRDVLAYLTVACEAQHLGLPAPSLLPLAHDAEASCTN